MSLPKRRRVFKKKIKPSEHSPSRGLPTGLYTKAYTKALYKNEEYARRSGIMKTEHPAVLNNFKVLVKPKVWLYVPKKKPAYSKKKKSSKADTRWYRSKMKIIGRRDRSRNRAKLLSYEIDIRRHYKAAFNRVTKRWGKFVKQTKTEPAGKLYDSKSYNNIPNALTTDPEQTIITKKSLITRFSIKYTNAK